MRIKDQNKQSTNNWKMKYKSMYKQISHNSHNISIDLAIFFSNISYERPFNSKWMWLNFNKKFLVCIFFLLSSNTKTHTSNAICLNNFFASKRKHNEKCNELLLMATDWYRRNWQATEKHTKETKEIEMVTKSTTIIRSIERERNDKKEQLEERRVGVKIYCQKR